MVTEEFNRAKLAYSISEFCDLTSLGKTKIYEEIQCGKIIARKLGKRTVILAEDGQNYLNALPVLVANYE